MPPHSILRDPAIPAPIQFVEQCQAFVLMNKAGNTLNISIPFRVVAMLEDQSAVRIVLAHRPRKSLHWIWNQEIWSTRNAPSNLKAVFVSLQILIEIIAV